MKDLSRNICLRCPICGNDQFSAVNAIINELSNEPDDIFEKYQMEQES